MTDRYNPHPHRCAGLPDGTRAYVVVLPQGERVQVYYDTHDGMDCVARAFRFCPGCGGSASFLMAVLRGEAPELPFGAVMAEVTIVRELPMSDSGARQCLVRMGDRHFVVSSVNAMFTGFETLVFPADADGKVTDWGEVAGGRGMGRGEAIEDLAEATWCANGHRTYAYEDGSCWDCEAAS